MFDVKEEQMSLSEKVVIIAMKNTVETDLLNCTCKWKVVASLIILIV